MSAEEESKLARRALLGGAVAAAALTAVPARSQTAESTGLVPDPVARNNISSFRLLDWRGYFSDTRKGAILADTTSRALHYWSEDLSVYRLFPTSVPLNEELTRRGRTEVIQKVVNPPWRPTKSMLERHPDWPEFIEGGSPDNPLGVRALYLGSSMYRIHGTDAPWTIGTAVSKGCIRMYNEDVLDLYPRIPTGTRVTVTWQRFKG